MKPEVEKSINLIRKSRLKEAFKAAENVFRNGGDKRILNRFYALESRFSDYDDKKKAGYEPNSAELNEIRYSFIELLSEIEDSFRSDRARLESLKPYFSDIAEIVSQSIREAWERQDFLFQGFMVNFLNEVNTTSPFSQIPPLFPEGVEGSFQLHSINYIIHADLNMIEFDFHLTPVPDVEIPDALDYFLSAGEIQKDYLRGVLANISYSHLTGYEVKGDICLGFTGNDPFSLKEDKGLSINGVSFRYYLPVLYP